MNKLDEGLNTYYVKDLKTGKIIPCSVRGGKEEQERQNLKLKKDGNSHLIRFEVVEKPVEKKSPGRKPAEKKD